MSDGGKTMAKVETGRDFERRARRRLTAWLRRSGYVAPGFEVRFDRSGAENGSERALYVTVRRAGSEEVHDVNFVADYPGRESVIAWVESAVLGEWR
jgi:hypothetical protein